MNRCLEAYMELKLYIKVTAGSFSPYSFPPLSPKPPKLPTDTCLHQLLKTFVTRIFKKRQKNKHWFLLFEKEIRYALRIFLFTYLGCVKNNNRCA